MPAISAHAGTLSIAGAPSEFLQAAATSIDGSTSVFQIANPVLRRLDPSTLPYVEVSPYGDTDPGAWVPVNFVVDPLFGTIYLYNDLDPAGLVRVSGYSLPVYQIGLVRSVSLSIANDVVELQVFGDSYKRRSVTLRDFSGEMTGLSLTPTDYEPGLTIRSLDDAFTNGAPLMIEVGKGAGSDVFRAWVKVPELSHKLTPGALYEHTVKFVGFSFPTGFGGAVAWGYGSP